MPQSNTQWKRICPRCHGEVFHVSKHALYLAKWRNGLCKRCSCKVYLRGYCKANKWQGKTLSLAHRKKISQSEKGKVESDITKCKKRLAHIKRLQKRHTNVYPNYNEQGCQLIDEYGKKYGYNFQHAMNGGEFRVEKLGYWVDGYDKEKNVVIEVYEPAHQNLRKQHRDEKRKREIIAHLNCAFIELRI